MTARPPLIPQPVIRTAPFPPKEAQSAGYLDLAGFFLPPGESEPSPSRAGDDGFLRSKKSEKPAISRR